MVKSGWQGLRHNSKVVLRSWTHKHSSAYLSLTLRQLRRDNVNLTKSLSPIYSYQNSLHYPLAEMSRWVTILRAALPFEDVMDDDLDQSHLVGLRVAPEEPKRITSSCFKIPHHLAFNLQPCIAWTKFSRNAHRMIVTGMLQFLLILLTWEMQEPAPDLDAITNQSEASKRKPLMLRYRHRTLAQSKQLQLGFQAKWKISELLGSGCSNLQRDRPTTYTPSCFVLTKCVSLMVALSDVQDSSRSQV